jgi:fermentation-respiration switch protein FrsA (DUF1100 family)
MSTFKKILSLLFFVLLSGCSHLFYQPNHVFFVDPEKAGFQYRNVEFKSEDGTLLKGWFFPARGKKALQGTFIQFHGNGDNMTAHFAFLVWVIDQGYNLFVFDYRGYGASDGDPSQNGLNQDAKAAIGWVEAHVPPPASHPRDLVLMGQSLGGAVLARALDDVRDRSRIRSVIIDSSFYDYHAIAVNVLSRFWISWPFQWLGDLLVSDEYSPEESFARISPIPILVIHGDRDHVIPESFGEKIYALSKSPKSFWKVDGGFHIDSMSTHAQEYHPRLMQYLEDLP